ncbi:hypothetical protein GCM10023238_16140 [Streptomyces heliomycini]
MPTASPPSPNPPLTPHPLPTVSQTPSPPPPPYPQSIHTLLPYPHTLSNTLILASTITHPTLSPHIHPPPI